MLENKLFEEKVYKINGVKFGIIKLSPSMFLDKDYLFPLSTIVEKEEDKKDTRSDRENLNAVEEFKDKMKDAILKGVTFVKSGIFSKKQDISTVIDKIMDNPELYSYLFTLIANHSLGVKKNFSHLFKLKKTTQELFT